MEKELGAAERESLVEEESHIDSSELDGWKNSCNHYIDIVPLLSFFTQSVQTCRAPTQVLLWGEQGPPPFLHQRLSWRWTSGRESSGREGWDWDRRSREYLIFYLYLCPLSFFALLSLTKGGERVWMTVRENLDDWIERVGGWEDPHAASTSTKPPPG